MSPLCKDPKKLCPCVRRKVEKLLEKSKEPLRIIETLRQADRQAHYFEKGVSWTLLSRHLPQRPSGLSLACDIAPVSLLKLKAWAPESPLWNEMGDLGTALGLKWGVWSRGRNIDKAHFEQVKCTC